MEAKKKKILYPVGTKVRIVKLAFNPKEGRQGYTSHPEDVGGTAIVVKYNRGMPYPYDLGRGFNHTFWVGELEAVEPETNQAEPADDDISKPCDCEDCRQREWVERTTKPEVSALDRAMVGFEGEMAEKRKLKELEELEAKLMFIEIVNELKSRKGEKKMDTKEATLRQRIRYAALNGDEKVLREAGFKDSTGAITEQGRRIILDTLFESDKDLQAAIVEAVKSTLPKEK